VLGEENVGRFYVSMNDRMIYKENAEATIRLCSAFYMSLGTNKCELCHNQNELLDDKKSYIPIYT
jgi:hypothetical protein